MSRHHLLRAGFALALAYGAAGQAAAAPALADLSTTITANLGTVNATGAVTYTVVIANPAQYKRVCAIDPDTHRPACEMVVNSLGASAVVVEVRLPTGMTAANPTGDSGFGCAVLNGGTLVRCSNGSIAAEDAGRISVPARAPNVGGAVTVTAVADPGNAIAERNEGNNSASVALTVRPPVNTNLPDLFAIVSSAQASFDGRNPVDFDVRIYNFGPVDAPNVTLEYRALYPSVVGTPSFLPYNGAISCPFIVGADGFFDGVRCNNLYVPAYNSVLMKLRMIPRGTVGHALPLPPGTNYVVYGTLDPDNTLLELNEINNLFNGGVLVKP